MSTMKVTNLRNESSSINNIVLNADGSVGGELATTLASKAGNTNATIQFADGTNSAPSITNTGDTNTGIYFPAASDWIAFTTGGVNRANITDGGRFGVGTDSPLQRLDVRDTGISGGNPASSGSASDPNAVARFGMGSIVADMGATSTGNVWLQARLASNYATNFALVLNPNGGKILLPSVWNNTTVGTVNMIISASGELLTNTSSAKVKTDIQDAQASDAEAFKNLRPRTFRSRLENDDPQQVHWGFIAEEVAEVDPRLAVFDADGEPIGVQYDRISAAALVLIKEQEERINALEARLSALETAN